MSALYYQSHFVWKTCSQFPFLRASMPAWRRCLLFRFYIIRRKNMTCRRSSSRKKLSIWKLLLLEVIGIDIFHVAILPHKWKKKASLLSSGIQASSIIHIPSFLRHIWRGKVITKVHKVIFDFWNKILLFHNQHRKNTFGLQSCFRNNM